ncbi:MAG: flavodoxin domain-containing protein [Parabacteroides sp.]|nr:flavodoxin domain-containing protein [Parabacteroides sp.]
MKTAIIYYSKHGTTERVAHLIGEKLDNEISYISLKEYPKPDIQTYDRIILGTSIYAGTPNQKVTQFCCKNRSLLEQKVIGLFICCMNKEQEEEELNKAFPEFLHRLTIPKAILGGEFQFDKMNFIERFLTKKIAKVNSSVSRLKYDEIKEFADKVRQ